MKTRFASQYPSSAGHALLIVRCITAASAVVLAATMSRTMSNSNMNARNNQYVAGLYAAEAATEKVFGMLKADFLSGNLTAITNHLGQYRAAIPLPGENAYWSKYQFSDGQGHVGSNYVSCLMSSWQLATNWGALPTQYSGLKRAGYKAPEVSILKQAYRYLYRSSLKLEEALVRIESEIPTPETLHLVAFIRASRRGIARE